jgi:REP element-mobilizing transposase RayT
MRLTDAGRMVEKWWKELENKFPSIEIDAFTTMPNHFHGILIIDQSPGTERNVGAALRGRPGKGHPRRGAPTLGDFMGWFKTMTTNEHIRGVKTQNWPAFTARLWQRNYYEHVIRNENELTLIREYIQMNPGKWAYDKENPEAVQKPPEKKEEIENILGGRP